MDIWNGAPASTVAGVSAPRSSRRAPVARAPPCEPRCRCARFEGLRADRALPLLSTAAGPAVTTANPRPPPGHHPSSPPSPSPPRDGPCPPRDGPCPVPVGEPLAPSAAVRALGCRPVVVAAVSSTRPPLVSWWRAPVGRLVGGWLCLLSARPGLHPRSPLASGWRRSHDPSAEPPDLSLASAER